MDPSVGRFISMDSVLGNNYDPSTLHKYTYASNNPVLYDDPTGLYSQMIRGRLAHQFITAKDFFERYGNIARSDYTLSAILDEVDTTIVDKGKSDIIDFTKHEVYEIKLLSNAGETVEQLERYMKNIAYRDILELLGEEYDAKLFHKGETWPEMPRSCIWPLGGTISYSNSF